MMGVDYDLFWTLNPKSLSPFIKAFELSQTNIDRVAWQNGIYIKMAIASTMDSKVKYPEKPYSSLVEDNSGLTDEELRDRKMNEIKDKMMERMLIINQKFKKGSELKDVE